MLQKRSQKKKKNALAPEVYMVFVLVASCSSGFFPFGQWFTDFHHHPSSSFHFRNHYSSPLWQMLLMQNSTRFSARVYLWILIVNSHFYWTIGVCVIERPVFTSSINIYLYICVFSLSFVMNLLVYYYLHRMDHGQPFWITIFLTEFLEIEDNPNKRMCILLQWPLQRPCRITSACSFHIFLRLKRKPTKKKNTENA